MVRNQNVPALWVAAFELVETKLSHVYGQVAVCLNDIISLPDDRTVTIVWADIVACIHKMAASGTKTVNALFQLFYN